MEISLSQGSIQVSLDGSGCRNRLKMDVRPSKVGFSGETSLSFVTPTSEGLNFFVLIPIWVLLHSMEIPLSQISIRLSLEGSGCRSRPKMGVRASKVGCPGETV